MKILMLNTYDIRGGAARATLRLFRGLKGLGSDISMLVQEKQSDDPDIHEVRYPGSAIFNPLRPYIDFAIPLLQTRKRILFSTAMIPDYLHKAIRLFQPDILHFNWMAGGFVRIETIGQIKQPIVWTLQDMWPFTGGCHYTGMCNRFTATCGKCPMLHSGKQDDLSHRVLNRKINSWQAKNNVVLTAPSNWMAQEIKSSAVFHDRKVLVVPNGLDTRHFIPVDKQSARSRLPISPHKRIIAFGAIRAVETPSKGFMQLVDALKILSRDDIQLVVFGSDGPGRVNIDGLDVKFLGMLKQDSLIIDLNSAADIVAVPSLQEVFGQTATEAMACGSPVLAFRSTGVTDIVCHKVTGYLAEPFEPGSLAEGIKWMLEDAERHRSLCREARKRAVNHFDIFVVAQQFRQIYQDFLYEDAS